MRDQREVARRAKIAYEGIETLDVGIASENASEFFEQCVFAIIGEEAGDIRGQQ